MELLNVLNEAQKEAVTTHSSYTRVVAGAGSGKTRVLITRIAYLISELGIFPSQIVAITFTNKAAKEMETRLIAMLKDQAAGVHISTIHSLCVTILRQDITALNYPRNFIILDSDDQKAILKEAYKVHDLDSKTYSYSNMLNYIGANKGEGIDGEKALKMAYNNDFEIKKAKIYQYYLERQAALFALDFDDLLLYTVRLLKTFEQKRKKWQSFFHYILVDEFQDVDRVQYELIRLLAGDQNEVYVVGDPDQTIYTWRGADVNIILNFVRDFEGAKTIFLNQNYRSTANILNAANALIHNNINRLEKDLFTKSDEGEKVYVLNAIGEDAEGEFIASKMLELHNQGLRYRDIAVLYRSNYLSREIEKVLAKYHIPYKIFGGLRFYERAEIKDILCYLRLIASGDDLAFTRVINAPKRGIGNKTLEKIADFARADGVSYMEAVKIHLSEFSGKAKTELGLFLELIATLRKQSESVTMMDLLELVLNATGYKKMLMDANEMERIENIKELQNDMMYFLRNNSEATLQDYLQTIALITDKDVYDEGKYVSLMTVHSAKGLEFDTVFVTSLSEGVFPNERAMSEGNRGLEEERRLAYVAFTRAKRLLFLSNSQGFSYVLNQVRLPSRFIKELDQDLLCYLGVSDKKAHSDDFFLEQEIKSYDLKEVNKFKKGDLVNHKVFGEGIVLSCEDLMVKVAFGVPHGIKVLVSTHPSLTKLEKSE